MRHLGFLLIFVLFLAQTSEAGDSPLVVPDDYPTIEEAFESVKDGGIITIKPGKYVLSRTLEIDRDITFQGSGKPEEIIIACPHSHVFGITGGSPVFQNLTVGSSAKKRNGFYVTGGTPKICSCVLTSPKGGGIFVEGKDADPIVEKCVLKNCGGPGACIILEGRGQFKDCEIYGNKMAGIEVTEAGNPTVTECQIYEGKGPGVIVSHKGRGKFKDCNIYENKGTGIEVNESGDPTFTECQIYDGKAGGVFIGKKGRGEFRGCDIYANALPGIEVNESGNPTFTECSVFNGKAAGVFIWLDGLGTFNGCEIYRNEKPGVVIQESGNPTFIGCQIHDGKQHGAVVWNEGRGTFKDCEIYANELAGIEVWNFGDLTVTGCNLHDGKSGGIYVHDKGTGTFNTNTLSKNYRDGKLSNWAIEFNAGKVKGSGNTPEMPKR